MSNNKTQKRCVVCGIYVVTDVDQTCGNNECKIKAHDKIHKMIQEMHPNADKLGAIAGACFV